MEELWKLESVELTESRQFVTKLTHRLKTSRDPVLLGELVEFYFKNGSKRARTILTSLRETHSQDYFDKLHESIQKTSTRLPVLKLLAHTLNSETSWLYRIIDHPLFTAILDQLKMSRDIVVLCSALFVVIAILPLVPSYIGTHLHQLFEIFCSLATIRDTNRLDLTPKELYLHLDVGVYYFFLQLYALFPNNLFQYLRTNFSLPPAIEKFNETIAPLFYQVQLHPCLITGGGSHELSRRKWGSMEPDDIATLSLQLCLDKHLTPDSTSTDCSLCGADHTQATLTEDHTHSTIATDHTPHTTLTGDPPVSTVSSMLVTAHSQPHTLTEPHAHTEHTQPHTHTSLTAPHNTLTKLPDAAGLKSSDELAQFWSPLVALGSITPHHSSNISPNDSSRNSVNVLTQHPSTVSSPPSDSALSSTLPTPRGTSGTHSLFTFKNYSPTASIEGDSLLGRPGGMTQSAVHTPRDEVGMASDPLSQSVRVEPSHHAPSMHGSPRQQARRHKATPSQSLKKRVGKFLEIFTRPSKPDSSTGGGEEFTEIFVTDADPAHSKKGGHSPKKSGEPLAESSDPSHKGVWSQQVPVEELGEECLADSLKEPRPLQSCDPGPSGPSASEPQNIPSLRPSRSDSQSSDTEDSRHDDLDFGQYTEPRAHSLTFERTADSAHLYSFSYPERGPTEGGMARGRMRTSLSEANTTQTVRLLQERLKRLVEADQGYKVPTAEGGSPTTSTPLETAPTQSNRVNLNLSTESNQTVLEEGVSTPQTLPSGPLTLSLNLNTSPPKLSRPSHPHSSTSLPTPSGLASNANSLGVGLANRLFIKRKSVCSEKTRNQLSDSSGESAPQVMTTPTATPSPVALLDQYINRGVVLHKGHFDTIPLTELEGVDWNHFGGCPHSEEFGLMQSQVVLLHSQLMFERYQCMQHARRNRTLLSQARSASKTVEELQTLRDQLRHQNEVVRSLQSDLQRRVYAHSTALQYQDRLHSHNQQLVSKNKQLRDQTLRLEEEVRALGAQNTDLEQQLNHSKDKLVSLENDHTHLQSHLQQAEALKKEVDVLSREVQVLGDLCQQQKAELVMVRSHTHQGQEAIQQCVRLTEEKEDCGAQCAALKQEVGMATARVKELESVVEGQRRELTALRDQLDQVQGRYQQKIVALENKYETMKTIGLHLESHILEIKGKTPLTKRKRHKRSISHPAGHAHTSLTPSLHPV